MFDDEIVHDLETGQISRRQLTPEQVAARQAQQIVDAQIDALREAQRLERRSEQSGLSRARVQAVIDAIQADAVILPTADNQQVRNILARTLQRQTAIIRALSWLFEDEG